MEQQQLRGVEEEAEAVTREEASKDCRAAQHGGRGEEGEGGEGERGKGGARQASDQERHKVCWKVKKGKELGPLRQYDVVGLVEKSAGFFSFRRDGCHPLDDGGGDGAAGDGAAGGGDDRPLEAMKLPRLPQTTELAFEVCVTCVQGEEWLTDQLPAGCATCQAVDLPS